MIPITRLRGKGHKLEASQALDYLKQINQSKEAPGDGMAEWPVR